MKNNPSQSLEQSEEQNSKQNLSENKDIEQIDEQSEYRLDKWKKSCRKYSRITPQVKDRLIFLIVRNNMSIKQAATSVKINYSSAKFIFNQYRHKNQKCVNLGTLNVGIRRLEKNQEDSVLLRCTVGGKFETESARTFSAEEVYNMNASKNDLI